MTIDEKALQLYGKMSPLDTYFPSQLAQMGKLTGNELCECLDILLYCEFVTYKHGVYFVVKGH